MPYLEELNSEIANAAAINQERLTVIEDLNSKLDEIRQSLSITQEAYVIEQQRMEGLTAARTLYLKTKEKDGN